MGSGLNKKYNVSSENLQKNIVEKSIKLSSGGFSMKCFATDF